MKKSVEKQIKEAFDAWDEQGNTPDYSKHLVWQSTQNEKEKSIFWSLPRVVAVVAMLLLGGGLVFSVIRNYQLQQKYEKQLTVISKPVEQKAAREVVIQKEIEVQYQTKIKEVVKESPELKAQLGVLKRELAQLKAEKSALRNKLGEYAAKTKTLTDSLELLKGKECPPLYAKNGKSNSDLTLNINKKALASLSIKNRKKNIREAEKISVGFKKPDSGGVEISKPLLGSIKIEK